MTTPRTTSLDEDESGHDPHPPTGRLTRDEQLFLADGLRRLNWGPDTQIIPELFDAYCAAFTSVGCELAVLRFGEGDVVEVLLLERPANDKFYAGQWHITGSLFWGHEPKESVFDRLVQKELEGMEVTEPDFVRHNHFLDNPRGAEVTLLHVCWAKGSHTGRGRWFPLNQPPDNTIEHHRVILRQVRDWLSSDQRAR